MLSPHFSFVPSLSMPPGSMPLNLCSSFSWPSLWGEHSVRNCWSDRSTKFSSWPHLSKFHLGFCTAWLGSGLLGSFWSNTWYSITGILEWSLPL